MIQKAYGIVEYPWDSQNRCTDGHIIHPLVFSLEEAEKILTDLGYISKGNFWLIHSERPNNLALIREGIWFDSEFWVRDTLNEPKK